MLGLFLKFSLIFFPGNFRDIFMVEHFFTTRTFFGPFESLNFKRILDLWLSSTSFFDVSTCVLPSGLSWWSTSHKSSVSFPDSDLGFFSIFTFLMKTSWRAQTGWQALSVSFLVLPGISNDHFLSSHLFAPLGQDFHLWDLADL